MSKNLNNNNLYDYFISLAQKESMNIEEVIDTLVSKGLFEDYTTFSDILLEDTHLFNWRGGQSTVFNRFHNSNIKTVKDLFVLYDLGRIDYGAEKINENFYIHDEMRGIIRLLQFKYLGIIPEDLGCLFNFNILEDIATMTLECESRYGYPGKIFNLAMSSSYSKTLGIGFVNDFYRVLKSCGFDQTCTKVLIDYAFDKKISNMCLGDYLLVINLDELKDYFKKVPQEYPIFLAIYNILIELYRRTAKKENGKSI